MDGTAGNTNAPLEGMQWQTAIRRAWQFVRPALVATGVLGLASLVFKGTPQSVLVGAFADLLSLTTIKLFLYGLLVVYGVSLALNKLQSASRMVRWIADRIASVTFDCTSTTLGVLVGMAPALAVDRSLKFAAAWAFLYFVILAFVLVLLWGATNLNRLSVQLGWPKFDARYVRIVGLLLVLIGVLAITFDGWRGSTPAQSKCANAASPHLKTLGATDG